jgi:glycosyltransferase involved in cell wall biosynthesis
MLHRNDARSLRVLMVCARFPPYIGGTEAHVSELSCRLADRGHQVNVLTTVLDPTEASEQVERGVVVRRVRAYPRRADLHMAPELHALVRDSGADIVHVQGYHTLVAPVAMNAASRAGLPYVLTFHSGGHSSRLRRTLRPTHHRLIAPLVQRARRVIGVSEFEREFFVRRMSLDPSRALTITNGVSDEFRQVPRDVSTSSRLITTIGRLEQYKGHQRAIKALPGVRRQIPQARLRVIGDGPYETELRAMADHLGVGDAVEFTKVPYGDRHSLAEHMAEADVIAMLSSYESQGIAGLEAVATGARLVVADGSALAELRRFEGVRVVPRSDQKRVVEALVGQLRLPRLARRPDVPTWDDTATRVETVYRDVLARTDGMDGPATEVACAS